MTTKKAVRTTRPVVQRLLSCGASSFANDSRHFALNQSTTMMTTATAHRMTLVRLFPLRRIRSMLDPESKRRETGREERRRSLAADRGRDKFRRRRGAGAAGMDSPRRLCYL